jgi:Flp pilus assembly protein TadD
MGIQMGMGSDRRIGISLLVVALSSVAWPLPANQQSAPTVRHHRVEEPADDSTSPEIDHAETAMQRQDYTGAETLLLKALESNPNDYRAWFDLGYIYTAT